MPDWTAGRFAWPERAATVEAVRARRGLPRCLARLVRIACSTARRSPPGSLRKHGESFRWSHSQGFRRPVAACVRIVALAVVFNAAADGEPVSAAGRVFPGYAFELPRDHFAHPSFDSEWWYYTGNLFTASGRHFGFELTFFRKTRAVDRAEPSAWDLDQAWLTHFTITDTREERFAVAERVNRAGPGIAGSDVGKRRIWNGNWSIEWLPGSAVLPIQVLTAMNRDAALQLTLEPRKPVVVHGRDGVSRKVAGDPQAVSYYLSFTRLEAVGTVAIGNEKFAVSGLAWMDHEFFADYPMKDKIGWDWMSIQLEDGVDLMIFGMRDAKGRYGSDTTGTLVDAEGAAHRVEFGGVRLRPGRRWRSESTGADYPVEWEVEVPSFDLRLDVRPRIDGQEVFAARGLLPPYWEGAVVVSGERRGRPVAGAGYLEMTGYAERLDIAGVGERGESDP